MLTVSRSMAADVDLDDLLVMNETRVIPARLIGKKVKTRGKVEILLLKKLSEKDWEVIVGGKGLVEGVEIQVSRGPIACVRAVLDGPRRVVRFSQPIEPYLPQIGDVPLPPYIHEKLTDPGRYQTVYAKYPGSSAAPTAGLHFTDGLIEKIIDRGVQFASVTLHIGLDTFAPVTVDRPQQHRIHSEWCQLSPASADLINQAYRNEGRIIAVGTTSVRTLETAAAGTGSNKLVDAFEGETSLYILPGYQFKVVDAMVTNFHLPRSTLLMMVSAFASIEQIMNAYQYAVQNKYRFYSFGDAMLIL